MHGLATQIINLLAAILLLISFAMLSQRRILALIHLYTLQGLVLALANLVLGSLLADTHLYVSAALTLMLKVGLIPWILYRLVQRLNVTSDIESLLNIPATLLTGIVLVIVAFNVALPLTQFASSVARGTLGIALACVLLSFLMMITRAKAIPQVIGFLSMENSLFFAAAAATNGMPMLVELGIGLDVLVGMLILGVFMFQIREQFDSLDIPHLGEPDDD
ncbi:MAG: formate hydrogenlyase [Paraburkholderia sp.]|uniref:formate hydrogenlyase n=1 Tax=Paraburkholderia sp. TaxID=1926495 RepID=UPI001205E9D5|nr:formate hydrogenlyase [Paraburkholderia sp.]TAL99994.1 MAG: formate hydrogenlyase [Paraburkholderia sp.]TAM32369.1 MAG: formate hydrogenlyase [Paraburkholderia sp.]